MVRKQDLPNRHLKNSQSNTKVKGKRMVIVSVFIIIILVLCSQLLYQYVIPRVTIDLRTGYHEALGGGGTGALINVNSKFINSGTIEIEDFQMTVTVLNSSQHVLTTDSFEQELISPGEDYELKLKTNGNCFETFFIELIVQFSTKDKDYHEKYLYKTHEDTMNIGYDDTIFDWGF